MQNVKKELPVNSEQIHSSTQIGRRNQDLTSGCLFQQEGKAEPERQQKLLGGVWEPLLHMQDPLTQHREQVGIELAKTPPFSNAIFNTT